MAQHRFRIANLEEGLHTSCCGVSGRRRRQPSRHAKAFHPGLLSPEHMGQSKLPVVPGSAPVIGGTGTTGTAKNGTSSSRLPPIRNSRLEVRHHFSLASTATFSPAVGTRK